MPDSNTLWLRICPFKTQDSLTSLFARRIGNLLSLVTEPESHQKASDEKNKLRLNTKQAGDSARLFLRFFIS
jgi:hypothetical protein